MKQWFAIFFAAALALVALGYFLHAAPKCKADARRIKMVTDLKHIALAARLYAEENDGLLPHDLESLFASPYLAPLAIDSSPSGALLYHRLGDHIDSIPETAIMLSYISKQGALYANYAGESSVFQQIIDWGEVTKSRAQ